MQKQTSRALMRSQTRAALLHSAQELLLERGYHETGIRDITAHADLSLATFYLHFRSKDDLIRQIGDELGLMFNQMMREWVDTVPVLDPDIGGRARRAFNLFMNATLKRKTLFLLIHRDWTDAPPATRHTFEESRAEFVRLLAKDMSWPVENGFFEPFPVEIAAEAVVAAYIRLVRNWLVSPQQFPREEVLETLVNMVVGLMRPHVKAELRPLLVAYEESIGKDW